MAGQRVTSAAGIRGVLFGVSAAKQASQRRLNVTLSYAGFAKNYGGAWSSRLHLVELPGCALTTPRRAWCRQPVPLRSSNNGRSQSLSAEVSLPGTTQPAQPKRPAGMSARSWFAGSAPASALSFGRAGSVVLAAVSGPSGSAGNFTATPLSPSGTWAVQQGDFTYTYPIDVPPSLGGAAPSVALGYDAQAIDSETSGSNTQGGWIGDGWSYSPGFIERSYLPCSKDGITNSGDECWGGNNGTLSLGGHSGLLVKDDTTGNWHIQGDDGTQVQLLSGAGNGLWNGQYWLVTTPDGTKYYFGMNHLPGGGGSDPATNSAWGVPVYCPNTTDPCYDSSKGQASEQYMGWRWNLDYVVDPLGNLTVYDYQQETNYYSMGGGQNNGNGTLTQYVRAGFLTQISYGWLLSDAIAGTSPAAQVQFSSAQRCTGSQTECSSYSNLNSGDASDWPDTPFDQICKSSGSCTNYSPTYFSTYMLTSIVTQARESGTYQQVDSYALAQSFPSGADSNPVIFLNSVTRTGKDPQGSAAPALPAVSFGLPVEIDNRVDGLVPAAPPVDRPRIEQITTEAGALIDVEYGAAGCSRVNNIMPTSIDSNQLACFPVYWTPPGESQIQDWFTKTLVGEVTVADGTGAGSPTQVTSYSYLGGAAWHQNEAAAVPSSVRTWDQYRGYAQVEINTGTAPDTQTETLITYMRGMDGDPNSSGGTTPAHVSDTVQDTYADSDWLAGLVLETDTYTHAGGTVDAKIVNGPWTYNQTASQAGSTGSVTVTAHMVAQTQARNFRLLASGTWQTATDTSTYYNASAQVTQSDLAPASLPETCTTTTYATPPSGNPMMEDYPAEVSTVTGGYASGNCPAKSSSDIVSDTRTYFDNQSPTLANLGTLGSLASPGGLPTGESQAATWPSGGSESWISTSMTGYDAYGRVLSATDADNHATSTLYTPAYASGQTIELPTQVKVTNPMGWSTISTQDQARQSPVSIKDVNSETTSETYDVLGRLTSVTLPIDQGTGDPTYEYSYLMTGTSPPAVTTQTLREDGSYGSDITIFDGMLQQRQEQKTPASAAAGRLISESFYDSHGWVVKARPAYYDSMTNPDTTLFVAGDGAIPAWTLTSYDGQDRPVSSQFYTGNALQWQSVVGYPGVNETDVTPPPGGIATSVFTDALGRTSASWQYTTATPDGNVSHADVTSYAYTPAGKTASVADNNGNTWTWTYNMLGQVTAATDPGTRGTSGPAGNAGKVSYTYDNKGNVLTSTDAIGQEISYAYDSLDRKTFEYNGTTTGQKLAAWTYDSAPLNGGAGTLGQLASATSYDASGAAYTEAITGYNTAYEPTGTSTSVPASALIPGTTGTNTYTTSSTYSTLTGLPVSTSYGADGGLPSETVNYSENLQGLLAEIGGSTAYLDDVVYSPQGQPERTTFGLYGKQLVQTYTQDLDTQRLLNTTTNLQTLSYAADSVGYTYDPSGNVTSVSDAQNVGSSSAATETQCFSYDPLGQLTAGWTDAGGTTANSSYQAGGIGTCTHTSPSAANIGGPATYWQTYSDDLLGDRTSETLYNTALPPAQDTLANATVQQIGYPGGTLTAPPTTPEPQPDAAQVLATTTPSATTTTTASHNADGGTTTLTSTGTSPLISAVLPSSGRLCADDFNGGTTSGTKADIAGCTNGTKQSFTIAGTAGSVKVKGLCLAVKSNAKTSGSLVELDTCSGTAAGQKWTPGSNGSLTNPNSGMCLTDPGNSTTAGTQLQITACSAAAGQGWGSEQVTYDPQGQVSSVATPAGGGTQVASYVYDADGQVIAQSDPSADAIYIDGGAEQLTYNPSTQDTTAQRFYPAPDGTTAVRTYDSKAGTTTITYDVANTQGTAQESIDATSSAITRRYFDPWGAPVGTPPAWPDNHAYLGKPADTATSYDLLGARQYNPATASFLTIDPGFQPGSPLAMGGYTYAADNPVANTDPTGLNPYINTGSCTGSIQYCEGSGGSSGSGSSGSGSSGEGSSGEGSGSGGTAPGSGDHRVPAPVLPYAGTPPTSLFEQPISIDNFIDDPTLLTGMTPEAILGRLGWTNGAPSGWTLTRLTQGTFNKGLGLVIRQTTESADGNVNMTGVMLRWYPGSVRSGHTEPNWKVSDGQTKFTGPNGEGFKTPQSEYWSKPGTVEQILNKMSETGEATPSGDGGDGGDGSGVCACGEPDPVPYGDGGEDGGNIDFFDFW